MKRPTWSSLPHRRRGVVHVWVGLVMMVIVGFVGLALDVSYGVLVAGQLQNAADAASLAAVAKVNGSQYDARQAAALLALANKAGGDAVQLALNEANGGDGDIVIGTYDRATGAFTPTLTSPNAVKVVARRTGSSLGGALPLFFGPIFGIDTVELERTAIAMMEGGGGAGVILLNEGEPRALFLTGNAVLAVNTTEPGQSGAVQTNSNDTRGVKTTGNSEIQADELNVVAPYMDYTVNITGDINTSSSLVPDPLGGLAEPADWGADLGAVSASADQSITIGPGHYAGGISISGNASVTMYPGLYVVSGSGLQVSGNGNLSGDGVMFYIAAGSVSLTGNGNIELTPLADGSYEGIVFWQARDNSNTVLTAGNGAFAVDGTIYLPSAYMQVSGNGKELGSQLICDTLTINGNGTFVVNYNGQGATAGGTGFLVK